MCAAFAACGGGGGGTPATNPAPTLDAITPALVTVGSPDTQVTLTGSDLSASTVVVWDGTARTATLGEGTALVITIPASELVTPARHLVRAINPGPGGGTSEALPFDVAVANALPVLSSLQPDHATIGTTTLSLELVGEGFAPGATVRFAGTARTATYVDDQHLSIDLAAADLAATASIQVSVINPGPGGGESAASVFGVVPVAGPAGVLERISVTDTGAQIPIGYPSPGRLDASGRYAMFTEYDGVVAGDTNGRYDVFVRDTCRGATACSPTTIPVSVTANGTFDSDADASNPAATPDLRYIVFNGPQSLIAGAPRFPWYLRDTCIGATGACTPTTIFGNSFSRDGLDLSADGRYVAFVSAVSYSSGDTNSTGDLYIHDTCIGASACTPSDVLVSATPTGNAGHTIAGLGGGSPTISASGRYIAFVSDDDNLVAGDTNAAADIFVRDTCLGATGACTPSTQLVSVDAAGNQGASVSSAPSISADGRFVSFATNSPLVTGAPVGQNVYLRDTCIGASACTPTTILVSRREDGGTGSVSASTFGPHALSADGRLVALQAYDGLLNSDANGIPDMYVRETCAGVASGCTPSTHLISLGPNGPVTDGTGNGHTAVISPTGAYACFSSNATTLVAGDTNNTDDVFLAATGF